MCGIGGILRTDGQPIPEEWLDAIDARIAYRGLDGCGRFRDRVEIDVPGTPALRAGSESGAPLTPGSESRATSKRIVEIAFVHRRLSIIDHAGGHQPMVSERGRNEKEGLVAVVFNGCIYNHRELRLELEGRGHKFVTDHSDTEVLIHGWREWGVQINAHLEGMYAFAIWDRRIARLYLAHDPFGEKPLYFRATQTWIEPASELIEPITAFSSEASSLYVVPAPPNVAGDCCRLQWLMPYLYHGYSSWFLPGPNLIDVQSIAPGSGYFRDAHRPEHEFLFDDDADENEPQLREVDFERLVEHAVARRLEADVPIGCFLSGGVDSSLVAWAARKHKPDLMTFSVRMPDERYDETPFAEATAHHLCTRHLTLDVSANPADDLILLVRTLGQPFGDSSILPTYWLSEAVRRHAKVALSGDGGDELFMGYERYLAAPMLARWRSWLARLPVEWLHRAHPKSPLHKMARLAEMARDYPSVGLAATEAIFSIAQLRELAPYISDPRWQCSSDEDHSIEDGLAGLGFPKALGRDDDALRALRDADIERYLPDDLLRKVDTASMACGLEVRCPFLDRDLARAALSAPIEQLMPGGRRKGLLRNIARKYLPREIVDRPKMGFAIPIGEWFRSDYGQMKTLLLDHLNSTEPFGPIQLNRKVVQRFIDEHMSGKRDHGQRLFTLLTLSIWTTQIGKAQSTKHKG